MIKKAETHGHRTKRMLLPDPALGHSKCTSSANRSFSQSEPYLILTSLVIHITHCGGQTGQMVLSEHLRFTAVHSLLPEREAGWVAGFFPVEYGNNIHDEFTKT